MGKRSQLSPLAEADSKKPTSDNKSHNVFATTRFNRSSQVSLGYLEGPKCLFNQVLHSQFGIRFKRFFHHLGSSLFRDAQGSQGI